MADERKLKHLEMIQGVINRLAANSFMLKGWSVFLISALFVLAARDDRKASDKAAPGWFLSLAGAALSEALRSCTIVEGQ